MKNCPSIDSFKTCKTTDDNSTLIWSQRGPKGTDRSKPRASVTTHFDGGAMEDLISCFNPLLTKLVLKWQTAQARTGNF